MPPDPDDTLPPDDTLVTTIPAPPPSDAQSLGLARAMPVWRPPSDWRLDAASLDEEDT